MAPGKEVKREKQPCERHHYRRSIAVEFAELGVDSGNSGKVPSADGFIVAERIR